jgi:hypothetical protein
LKGPAMACGGGGTLVGSVPAPDRIQKNHGRQFPQDQGVSPSPPTGRGGGRSVGLTALSELGYIPWVTWGGNPSRQARVRESEPSGCDGSWPDGIPEAARVFPQIDATTTGQAAKASVIVGGTWMARPQRGPHRFREEPVPAPSRPPQAPHFLRSRHPERPSIAPLAVRTTLCRVRSGTVMGST